MTRVNNSNMLQKKPTKLKLLKTHSEHELTRQSLVRNKKPPTVSPDLPQRRRSIKLPSNSQRFRSIDLYTPQPRVHTSKLQHKLERVEAQLAANEQTIAVLRQQLLQPQLSLAESMAEFRTALACFLEQSKR